MFFQFLLLLLCGHLHENQVLGVVSISQLLPHPEIVSSLGVVSSPTRTDVEDGALGDGVQKRRGLGAGAGGEQRRMAIQLAALVCDSHLGTYVVTGSAQAHGI